MSHKTLHRNHEILFARFMENQRCRSPHVREGLAKKSILLLIADRHRSLTHLEAVSASKRDPLIYVLGIGYQNNFPATSWVKVACRYGSLFHADQHSARLVVNPESFPREAVSPMHVSSPRSTFRNKSVMSSGYCHLYAISLPCLSRRPFLP